MNVQFTTKLLFLHSRSDYRYLLVVILLRSFVLLFFIFLLSVGIGDHGVGHDDGGPAKTLGVHFQLSWSGLQAGDVARQQLLSSHQHQSDYDIGGKKKCQNSCMGSTLCYMYSGFRPVSSPLQHVQPVQGGGDVLRTDAGQFAEVSDGNLLIAELVHALQHHAPPVGHVGQPPQVRQGLLWRSWLALALRQQVA